MKTYGILLLLSCTINVSVAQVLVYNLGADIYLKTGSETYVKTGSLSNAGLVENAGLLEIEGSFINNDTATGGSAAGLYRVQQNWENNAAFRADQSRVELYGNDQLITGTQVTRFYDLELTGGGIKRQTIHSETTNNLILNDRELATDQYEMLVSNTHPAAIARTSGFVSSLDTGRLSRNTASTQPYLFPTGSSLGTLRYRPIVITPSAAIAHTFGVRLANVDATIENFDRQVKHDTICEVNPLFYHRIYRSAGTVPADVEYNYIAALDGTWDGLGHWQTVPRWEPSSAATGSNAQFSTFTLLGWNDFSYPAFALVRYAPDVFAGRDTTIARGSSVQLNPVITGAFNSLQWSPGDFLSCSDCPNPVSTPENEIRYTITLNSGGSCQVSDDVLIRVENYDLDVPQAFTPNADGTNDYFLVFSNGIETFNIKIFNRWGEKVFESDSPAFRWDGTYQGQMCDMAVFVYLIEAKFAGVNDKVMKSGSITLIR